MQDTVEPEVQFFTIEKARLKYDSGILNIESLEIEIFKMFKKVNGFLADILGRIDNMSEQKVVRGKLIYVDGPPILNVFVHNLGAFDGIFIFKYLTKFYPSEDINTIIDKQNKFITITLTDKMSGLKIKFLDSYRLFPVSLNNLAKVFKVKGKSSEYNDKFHDLSVFYDPGLFKVFKEYSIQDSIALWNTINLAQLEYWDKYQVDITTVVSASSLAFKIFRSKYLKVSLPIPYPDEDNFIRDSYYGGATDVYKAQGVKMHYIDINSLYPAAMLNKIPFEFKGFVKDMSNIDLSKFFGFVKVEVSCPDSVTRPILPLKFKGKTIFPTGKWTGTYFSEEIKAVISKNLGYEFKLISGYEFTGKYIFKNYVKDLYKIKQFSRGPERFIAKLLLNTLYGIFGRRQDATEVFVVDDKKEDLFEFTHLVLNSIPLHNNRSAKVVQNNIRLENLTDLNAVYNTNFQQTFTLVNSNIAIASSVTSYARIAMMDVRLHPACYYTDTDSAFVDSLEPFKHLIGPNLGQFKDELNGGVIEEAEFLGIKQYGYWFYDENGKRVEKSVFAGVKRDSLSFDQIKHLQKGGKIIINAKDRFYKSLLNLNISIKSLQILISKTNNKIFRDNFYFPSIINKEIRETDKEISLLKVGKIISKNLTNRLKKIKLKICK